MQTIKLNDDQSVTLRELEDLTVRHKRVVESAAIAAGTALMKLAPYEDDLTNVPIAELGLSEQEAQSLYHFQDATIVASLESWTLGIPLPTMETIEDLKPELQSIEPHATPA